MTFGHNNNSTGKIYLLDSEKYRFKRKYLSPRVSVQKIALEFDVTITSTSIRSGGGGPDQDPKIEDWKETKGPTYDLDF